MENEDNILYDKRLSKRTKRILKRNGLVVCNHEPKKPKTLQSVNISENFDILQYYGVVRSYICAKHNITMFVLEALCAAYPMGVFTKGEFDKIPNYPSSKLSVLVDKGLVSHLYTNEQRSSRVFALSVLGKKVVAEAHRYLLNPEKMSLTDGNFTILKDERQKIRKLDKLIGRLKKL